MIPKFMVSKSIFFYQLLILFSLWWYFFVVQIENTKLDIFGHSVNGIKKLECVCPNCSRTCAAFRLAPHLEKCLGMGRNSSRLASKRIALVIKNSNGANSE